MILVNGYPKSGTHALQKACNLLGYDTVLNHIPYGNRLPEEVTKHLLIIRDPRNAVISWIRMKRMPVTEGMVMSTCMKLIPDMQKFVGWIDDPTVSKIKFEDLISNSAEMRKLAFVLGTPYVEGAFEQLPGYTRTWSGDTHTTSSYSDFHAIWTPGVECIWDKYGGNKLLNDLEYEQWKF